MRRLISCSRAPFRDSVCEMAKSTEQGHKAHGLASIGRVSQTLVCRTPWVRDPGPPARTLRSARSFKVGRKRAFLRVAGATEIGSEAVFPWPPRPQVSSLQVFLFGARRAASSRGTREGGFLRVQDGCEPDRGCEAAYAAVLRVLDRVPGSAHSERGTGRMSECAFGISPCCREPCPLPLPSKSVFGKGESQTDLYRLAVRRTFKSRES